MNKKWEYLSDKFNNKDNLYGEQLSNFSTFFSKMSPEKDIYVTLRQNIMHMNYYSDFR